MIYVNGCSYTINDSGDKKNFGKYLSEIRNTELIHRGIQGSCNDRIFRTTTRDLLNLHAQNVKDVIVLVSLTFWFRTELWYEDHNLEKWYKFGDSDGQFISISPVKNSTWKISDYFTLDKKDKIPSEIKNYLKYFVLTKNRDGSIIKILHNAVLLNRFCNDIGYKLIIFYGADDTKDTRGVDKTMPAIIDFKKELDKSNSFDLLDFSFCEYYYKLGHKPYDYDINGKYGHHGSKVHKLFAEKLNEKI